ncbi:MAG: hypothetical protein IT373_14750 [Polyangiaceae bacterium]|nr:hypothetical protein [Polyangiaceae bacterium]
MPVLRVTLAALALVASLAPSALAGELAEDGGFVFAPTAVARLDFESELPPPPDPASPPPTRTASDTALSGAYVLELAAYESQDFVLELPALGQSYRVSLWLRGGDSVGYFTVSYGEPGRVDELATLYPTGRMTTDGWVELANEGLRVDGLRAPTVSVGIFSAGGAEVDAVEIVPDGAPVLGPMNPACGGIGDAGVCGVGQLCMWNECRNVNGWVPPIPAARALVTEYLENRLRFLFGPYANRAADLPGALLAVEEMRHASDPFSYWNGFTLALRRLHDGHTTTSGTADYALDQRKPLSVCFLEGEADASQASAPSDPDYLDVLVSHVGADHHLGLHAGDRLVAVDGRHPIAWARSLREVHWSMSQASNPRTFAELAAQLRGFIGRYAHDISVVRCSSPASCGPVEVLSIAELPADPLGTPVDRVSCDSRPLRHLASSPPDHAAGGNEVYHGLLLESDATEKIYGVEWESLDTSSGQDGVGAALKAAVNELGTASARGAVFDHRTGNGGTVRGAEIVWNLAVPRHPLTYFETRPRAEDEQPTLADGLARFQQALGHGLVDYAGSASPSTIPVALLVTRDVSASDWLPLGMKGAPHVRIFGPYETSGGFSTRYVFGYWFGLEYVLATGDTYTADGATLNGTGVTPDVVVRPLQSDLLAGKDTVFEAALAWIRGELP